MPRNFSDLKSGGTIPMLSPHPEKWGGGGGTRPPRPPPIDARGHVYYNYVHYITDCTNYGICL